MTPLLPTVFQSPTSSQPQTTSVRRHGEVPLAHQSSFATGDDSEWSECLKPLPGTSKVGRNTFPERWLCKIWICWMFLKQSRSQLEPEGTVYISLPLQSCPLVWPAVKDQKEQLPGGDTVCLGWCGTHAIENIENAHLDYSQNWGTPKSLLRKTNVGWFWAPPFWRKPILSHDYCTCTSVDSTRHCTRRHAGGVANCIHINVKAATSCTMIIMIIMIVHCSRQNTMNNGQKDWSPSRRAIHWYLKASGLSLPFSTSRIRPVTVNRSTIAFAFISGVRGEAWEAR